MIHVRYSDKNFALYVKGVPKRFDYFFNVLDTRSNANFQDIQNMVDIKVMFMKFSYDYFLNITFY